MELGLWLLFGLTVTSSAGFSRPAPRPRHLADSGRSPRSPAVRERAGVESQGQATIKELPASSDTGHGGKVDGLAMAPAVPRRRAKRCTCYTYKDKECVYYCHLDIIWINTPECTQRWVRYVKKSTVELKSYSLSLMEVGPIKDMTSPTLSRQYPGAKIVTTRQKTTLKATGVLSQYTQQGSCCPSVTMCSNVDSMTETKKLKENKPHKLLKVNNEEILDSVVIPTGKTAGKTNKADNLFRIHYLICLTGDIFFPFLIFSVRNCQEQ